MTSNADRNPSPPPEILNNEDLVPDRIGDSLYSKKWLFKTLMAIVELCEKPVESVEKDENSRESPLTPSVSHEPENQSTSKPTVESDTKPDMIELDPKVEEDACTLWDISANREVAQFLCDSGVPKIFLDVIDKTKSPRLLEIVLGILGNMSSFDSICEHISTNKSLLQSVVLLSGTTDSPSLLQVFRVILCGVSNEKCQNLWFSTFDENPFFMENMNFILGNSLNSSVIRGAFQLLYSILNENMEYCKLWGQQPYIKAIIDAGKQLKAVQESLDNFFCVLNCLCQYTPNVEMLVENWLELNDLFTPYFLSLEEEEALPNRSRITAIFSCFDIYNTILKSENMNREILKIDIAILNAMSKISSSVNSLILDIRKDNMAVLDLENPQEDPPRRFLRRIEERNGTQFITMMTEYEFRTWTVLADTIIETAKTLMDYAEKENEKEILEDILSAEIVKENIGVLII